MYIIAFKKCSIAMFLCIISSKRKNEQKVVIAYQKMFDLADILCYIWQQVRKGNPISFATSEPNENVARRDIFEFGTY